MKYFFFLIFFANIAAAAPVSREVLALWDSSDYADRKIDPVTINIHRKLEIVFNYFGWKLTYHDVDKGLPESMTHSGIVTWFVNNRMKNPVAYGKWLRKNLLQGKKILVLGEPGFTQNDSSSDENLTPVNDAFSSLGWEFSSRFYDNPALISIKSNRGKDYTEFERGLDQEVPSYRLVKNKKKENSVWLTLTAGTPESDSDVIISSEKGAYVQEGFALFIHPQNQRSAWRANPFELISEVFRSEFPIPDVTTLNGRRIFFSHIDGDGFRNVSSVDRKRLASEVIRDEVLLKYFLPVTVSVIIAEMDPALGVVQTDKFLKVARSIFTLPHIEPASHTAYHPLSWSQNPDRTERESYLGKATKSTGPILAWRLPGITLDYERETAGSLNWINKSFFKGQRKANLLLWSGNCRPPPEALKPLERENFINMNGGDSRMDSLFNSVGHLSSLYRNVNGMIQVYSGNANENIYTDLWSPPFAGFKDVVQTFERTETPRRLKPVNVYYHFYSGEHFASLAAVKAALDWSLKEKLHPVFASEYVGMARGFISIRIDRRGPGSFRITENGELRTLRMKFTGLVPDYQRSKNVLGHHIEKDQIYIALGDEVVTELELAKPDVKSTFLVATNARVKKNLNGSFTLNGHVPVEAVFSSRGKLKSYSSQSMTMTIDPEKP